MMLGFVLNFFIGFTDVLSPMVQELLAFPIAAIPLGGMFVAVLGLIADLTDYDQLKSGPFKNFCDHSQHCRSRSAG